MDDYAKMLKIKENIEQKLEDKHITLKQWKTKQIYEAIISNTESTYKEYCEKHNNISKILDWDTKWDQFILSVKNTCSFEDAKPAIKAFIEDLSWVKYQLQDIIFSLPIRNDWKDKDMWTKLLISDPFQNPEPLKQIK
jgi:hypothetical protein